MGKLFTMTAAALLVSLSTFAQTGSLTGTLTGPHDSARAGVRVFLTGTSFQAITGKDGFFSIDSVPFGSYTLEQTDSVGEFVPLPVLIADAEENLGLFHFESRAAQSDDNIPAVSTADDDQRESSMGVSSVLNSSNDAFESAVAYNFSMARYRLRGYADEDFVTYMNGAPMEDLSTDRTLYNTWSGLNDVMRNRESSLGLAPVNFGFGSTGGAWSVNSQAAVQRRQLQVSYALSNRAYDNRLMVTWGSGVMKNGWSVALSYSRRWAGEGYVEGTFYDGHSWFASVEKIINSRHSLSLTAFGAPTRYGRALPAVQEMYDLAGTHYYNPAWGYQNGEKRNASVARNHRPVVILSHEWDIDANSSLQTSAWMVAGKSKLSGLDWYNASDPRPDYYRKLPSYVLSSTGDTSLYHQALVLYSNDTERQIKWDDLYQSNVFGSDTSLYVVADRVTATKTYGMNTVFNKILQDHDDLSAGATFIRQKSSYYGELEDLLGGQYFVNLNQFADESIPGNNQYDLNNPDKKVYVGDRYHHDYDLSITQASAWAQYVCHNPRTDLFGAARLSNTSFYRTGNMRNGVFADKSYGDSPTESYFNYALKGGLTYKIDGRNYLFVNGSFRTSAPLAENVFISPMTNNIVVPVAKSLSEVSAEGGYLLRTPRYKARAVAYITQSSGGTDVRRFYHDDFRTFVNYAITGIDTRHVGTEISVTADLQKGFTATGVLAIGQNFYTSRQTAFVTQDNLDSVLASNVTIYSENLRTGGSPEQVGSLGLSYRSPHYWHVYVNGNFFGGNYVQFNPIRHTAEAVDQLDENSDLRKAILGQEKLDNQFTLDISAGWSWKLNNSYKSMKPNTYMVFNIGVNNVLNNTNLTIASYEQLRFDFINQDITKFDNKYLYAFGTNYFASVTLRFN